MRNNLKLYRLPIEWLSLLGLATLLPLERLQESLWHDEGSSVWFARLPLTTLLNNLCDPHPPGYYLLLKAWLIGGENEPWLRLPSLLAAVLAAALTYRLGREQFGRRGAWLAALLLATCPLQSWYAGEVRMYILVQCLGLLWVWLGWRLLSKPEDISWSSVVFYWLTGLLALGVDYGALLAWGVLQLFWLTQGYPRPRFWIGLQGLVLVPAGFLWGSGNQLQALSQSYLPILIAVQANRFGLPLTPATAALGIQLILISLSAICLAVTWYNFHHSTRLLVQPMIRYWLIGTWVALLLLAAIPRAFTFKRQLIVILPYLALLAGYSLTRLPRWWGEFLAGAGLLITFLALPAYPREPWRNLVAGLVPPPPHPPAIVWVDELSVPVFDYYLRQTPVMPDQIHWVPLVGRDLPQLPDLEPQPGGTLWIVTAESLYRHLVALLPAEFYHHYRLQEEAHEGGVGLYHYQRQRTPFQDSPPQDTSNPATAWGLLFPSPLDTCSPE